MKKPWLVSGGKDERKRTRIIVCPFTKNDYDRMVNVDLLLFRILSAIPRICRCGCGKPLPRPQKQMVDA